MKTYKAAAADAKPPLPAGKNLMDKNPHHLPPTHCDNLQICDLYLQAYPYKYWQQYLYNYLQEYLNTYLCGRDRVQMCQNQINSLF